MTLSVPQSTVAVQNDAYTKIMADVPALVVLLEEAREVQFTLPPRRRASEDTAERSKGPHSDPTADTATDERRLALSQQIKAADVTLLNIAVAVGGLRRGLERRLAEWGADHE